MDTACEELRRASPQGRWPFASPTDRRRLDRDAVLDRVRDARFSDGIFCPRCGHREVQRWGTFSGRQRYHCKHCQRTFSDLTGTPAAYLKKVELLPAYCGALATQLSIRKAALRLGIHPSTAFRWRHRILDDLRARDSETLTGWIELGSFWLPESHKGQRHLERRIGRPPRRRGSRGRWNLFYDGPRIHVVVACDRTGHVVSTPYPHPTKRLLPTGALEAALEGRLEHPGSLNLTASREARSVAMTFAIRTGATYHDAFLPPGRLPPWIRSRPHRKVTAEGQWRVPAGAVGGDGGGIRTRPGDRSLVHTRTVVPYIRRFREWLRPFRGVATRYLANYLLWHRLVDAGVRNHFTSILLRWPRQLGARR